MGNAFYSNTDIKNVKILEEEEEEVIVSLFFNVLFLQNKN